MFEAIWDALIWIMSWAVDRRLHSEQAFRLLLLMAFTVLATLLALYWKNFAYRSSAIRRRLMPGERYAGRYLQAVWRNGEVRYSFVNIFYNARRRRYEVAGRTYSPAGEKLNDFNSTYVLFPSSKDADIEFIWRARNASRGYTRMTLEDFKGGLHSGRRARHYIQFLAESLSGPFQASPGSLRPQRAWRAFTHNTGRGAGLRQEIPRGIRRARDGRFRRRRQG